MRTARAPLTARTLLAALLLWPLGGGCGGDDTGVATVPSFRDTGNTQDRGTTVDQGPAPAVDTGAPDPGAAVDTGPADTGQPVDTAPPPLTSKQRACGLAMADSTGTKRMGERCEDHDECATGYCYDEWYMSWPGGFRFCTIACNGCGTGQQTLCSDFNQSDDGSAPMYTCVIGGSCHAGAFGEFDVRGICVPQCNNDFGRCQSWFPGAGYQTCQTPFVKSGDCGTIGVLRACFVPEP